MTAENDKPTPVAQLVDVHVRYSSPTGPIHAVNGVSATMFAGESTAIVGRSGSGKSSLIAVLSLMRRPTSGRVLLAGHDAALLSQERRARLRGRAVGVVFQSFHLDSTLSARENVMLPWTYRGSGSRRSAKARADAILRDLDMAELARTRPNRMSGGQRQRVAIARALFSRPALLIADEPTGNLDEQTAGEVAAQLFGLSRTTATAVVVVTHDRSIADLADHRLVLQQGRLGEVGPSATPTPAPGGPR